MRVKTQFNLQPAETQAHSVVIEDDMGNPIIVATQLTESIVFSTVNDPDFQSALRSLGITKTVKITEFKPKPLQDIIWTP
jgi:hypothetical protein